MNKNEHELIDGKTCKLRSILKSWVFWIRPKRLTSDVQSSSVVLPVQTCDFVEVKPVHVIQTWNTGFKELLWLIDIVHPAMWTRGTFTLRFNFFCFWAWWFLLWNVAEPFLLLSYVVLIITIWESPTRAISCLLFPFSRQRGIIFIIPRIRLVQCRCLSGLWPNSMGVIWLCFHF